MSMNVVCFSLKWDRMGSTITKKTQNDWSKNKKTSLCCIDNFNDNIRKIK